LRSLIHEWPCERFSYEPAHHLSFAVNPELRGMVFVISGKILHGPNAKGGEPVRWIGWFKKQDKSCTPTLNLPQATCLRSTCSNCFMIFTMHKCMSWKREGGK